MFKKIIVVSSIVMVIVLFFIYKNKSVSVSSVSRSQDTVPTIVKRELVRKKIHSALSLFKHSAHHNRVDEDESVFNDRTGLSPIGFEEAKQLTGKKLEQRVRDLDSKLSEAIRKYPDLPPPPKWYIEEMNYLSNKYFRTVGKSRYVVKMSVKQKKRQQAYINYLRQVMESGEAVSDEERAEMKRQIIGE